MKYRRRNSVRAWCRPLLPAALAFFVTGDPPLAQDGEAPAAASWQFESIEGLYRLSLRPADPPLRVGEYQGWILNVQSADGGPVYPARIAVGGGMQAHGHGLPSQPLVTAYGGDGDYLIEGVRLNMEGTWRLSFVIESEAGSDRADVEIEATF